MSHLRRRPGDCFVGAYGPWQPFFSGGAYEFRALGGDPTGGTHKIPSLEPTSQNTLDPWPLEQSRCQLQQSRCWCKKPSRLCSSSLPASILTALGSRPCAPKRPPTTLRSRLQVWVSPQTWGAPWGHRGHGLGTSSNISPTSFK